MTTYTLTDARKLTDAELETAYQAARPLGDEIAAKSKATIAAELAKIGKTEDTATGRQYSAASDVADAMYDEEYRSVYYNLFVAREERREQKTRESAAARKSVAPNKCPKCGHVMTASNRCDDCDDNDN